MLSLLSKAFFLLLVSRPLFSSAGGADYFQLASSDSQNLAKLGHCTTLKFDDGDDTMEEVKAPKDGDYFILAAPQVGAKKKGRWTADFWIQINGDNAENSNVRISAGSSKDKDVIVTQGVYELKKGDKISVCGSGKNARIEYIQKKGEPDIPSVIFTMYSL